MFIALVIPSNHLILCHPLSLLPSSFPAWGSFQMSHFFASGGQSIGVSASASVLSMNIQDWFPVYIQDWLVWSPCSPRGSQESSPTPQFKSINSSVLSLLWDFPGGSDGKESAYNADSPGEGNGNPLQYSCLENPMDTVHRVAKSQTQLSDFTSAFFMVQLSHPYITTGKAIALTWWTKMTLTKMTWNKPFWGKTNRIWISVFKCF